MSPQAISFVTRALTSTVLCALVAVAAHATPDFVEHTEAAQVFGESAGVTTREPLTPREEEPVQVWARIGYSFQYNQVAVYYTTDGSEPTGAFGVGAGNTQVLAIGAGGLAFVRNEPSGSGTIDWWVATLPIATRDYETNLRYKVSAWHSGGGPEIFSNNSGCSDGVCDNPAAPAAVYSYTTLLAWPGAGFGSGSPNEGYPPIWHWKEEAVVGNHYINVMLDQNGALYDVYYPSVGAVQGVGTKNEGYDDGNHDEFPNCLSPDQRGQMHLNQAMVGLRVDGMTYWVTNQTGSAYSGVTQTWLGDTNVVQTSATLVAGGNQIEVVQTDFAPWGISYPLDDGAAPNRGLAVKRIVVTNHGATPKAVNLYFYADWALNGGDGFDGAFIDATRGAMIAYDNTARSATGGNGCAGEYNPTTFGAYSKDVSLYLGAAMKQVAGVGSSGGDAARDFWLDSSADQGHGWVGMKLTLNPEEAQEVDILIVGGFDNFAGATGTYDFQMAGPIDWFLSESMGAQQSLTEDAWEAWLAGGVQFTSPDPSYNELFKRSLLTTALHLDGKNGGIIAGMHNGAYPFVWPRDAAWAAITLARTGFVEEAKEIYRFLRDVAYRDVEGWGRKGFWKQKYSTDGYTIWGNPQVDETSCYPWGVRYIYDVTGDLGFLEAHYDEVYEAGLASSQTSTFDSRLRYDAVFDLVDSMSLWEDAFGLFNYSNASVVRGLEDAAAIADVLDQSVCPGGPGMCGYHTDRALFLSRAAAISAGLDARLAWNGENCDISQLGIVYPMEIYPPGHPRAELIADRINGVATDAFGNNHPLVNFAGGPRPEWEGLINRYWGDGYWNGGPWYLSTLWYGAYYAQRNNVTAGKADIDNLKYRIDLLLNTLGPMGYGAEQIAGDNALKYPGQTDYRLQTAYPNAWESMAFLVDSLMLFLDFDPDAPGNVLRIRPKLPTGWSNLVYENLRLGNHRIDVEIRETAGGVEHRLTNVTGLALGLDTVLRVPVGAPVCEVRVNSVAASYTHNSAIGAVHVATPLATGPGAVTSVRVLNRPAADVSGNGVVDFDDITAVLANWGSVGEAYQGADTNGDGVANFDDITAVLATWGVACP